MSQPPPPQTSAARNVLGADVRITGTLKFAEELIFDGKLDGEILSPGNLTVGKSARIEGEVKTRTVVVHGTVDGNIVATERCQLNAGSSLTGDLKAARLLIEKGATFIGKSEVTTSPRAENPKPARAPEPAGKRN
ncbi:MAG: bactofilin family protein [Chthoniobacterales bacterium]